METPLSPFTLTPDPPESDFFEKYRYYIFGGLLLILSLGVYLMLTPPRSTLAGPDIKTAGEIESIANSETANPTNGKLVVDIAGAVIKPGVYWLDAGKIVEDAINSAGGLNMKKPLAGDGLKVFAAKMRGRVAMFDKATGAPVGGEPRPTGNDGPQPTPPFNPNEQPPPDDDDCPF